MKDQIGLSRDMIKSLIYKSSSFLMIIMISVVVMSCKTEVEYPSPVVKGEDLIVDISSIENNVPRFFAFSVDEKRVKFFVVKKEGRIESYLDACKKCYIHKKGYRVEGSHVVCTYCDVGYPINSLDKGIGSCYPIPIAGKLKGKHYFMRRSDLEKAMKYF